MNDRERRPVSPERRRVLRALSTTSLVVLASPFASVAKECEVAVRTDAGPFYPENAFPWTNDLTRVPGVEGVAAGRPLYLSGRVTDRECKPVANVTVEVWQTDDNGGYRHPDAENDAALDPCFRYFAKVETGDDGEYAFKTIRPRPYTFQGLNRAPHVHIRFRHAGSRTLTSEVYFEGELDERLRKQDRIFQGRGKRKDTLVVPFDEATTLIAGLEPDAGMAYCRYDVALEKART